MNKLYLKYLSLPLDGLHTFFAVISIILYAVGSHLSNTSLMDAGFWILFAAILSFLLHRNQKNLSSFLLTNRDSSHVAIKQIRIINNSILALFLLFTGGFLLLLPKLPYQGVVNAIKNGILAVLSAIFLPLFTKKGMNEPIEEELKVKNTQNLFEQLQESSNKWSSILDEILRVLFDIAFVLLLLWGLWKLLLACYKKILSFFQFDGIETREFVAFQAEKKNIYQKQDRERPLFTDRSANGRIRKLYKRTIKKNLKYKQTISTSATPLELENQVGVDNIMLHQTYEKARYSKDGCNSKDYEEVKKI